MFYSITFVLRNTDPMQREWICSFADKQLNLCSIKDNLYTHTLCVFVAGQALFVGISGFIQGELREQ